MIETFKTKYPGKFLFPSLELLYNLPDLFFFRSEKGLCPKTFPQKMDCNKKCQPDIQERLFFWMTSLVFKRYLKSIITLGRWASIQHNWLLCFLIPGREISSLVLQNFPSDCAICFQLFQTIKKIPLQTWLTTKVLLNSQESRIFSSRVVS